MKSRKIVMYVMMGVMSLILSACSKNVMTDEMALKEGKSTGDIYLYGEVHGEEKILNKELEEWERHYNNEGMRHLFVELPYYTAEFLNIWMQADQDEILDAVYDDSEGTASHKPEVKAFYKNIKKQCLETIFHGTDVGHQYNTTGERYLEYLKDNGLENSEQYALAADCIEQGKYYYEHEDHVYRENQMVLNFMRVFDKLGDQNIMGIYGAAHTELDAKNFTGEVLCMANQLKKRYGEHIVSEDLSDFVKDIEPFRIDTMTINEEEYKASYFGKADLTGMGDYAYGEYWRLEDAYNDFKDSKKSKNVLPYSNYPMLIEEGQIFVIDYTKLDGSVERKYYYADGTVWKTLPSTVEIIVE